MNPRDLWDHVYVEGRAWLSHRENAASVISTVVSTVIFTICYFLAKWVFSP